MIIGSCSPTARRDQITLTLATYKDSCFIGVGSDIVGSTGVGTGFSYIGSGIDYYTEGKEGYY